MFILKESLKSAFHHSNAYGIPCKRLPTISILMLSTTSIRTSSTFSARLSCLPSFTKTILKSGFTPNFKLWAWSVLLRRNKAENFAIPSPLWIIFIYHPLPCVVFIISHLFVVRCCCCNYMHNKLGWICLSWAFQFLCDLCRTYHIGLLPTNQSLENSLFFKWKILSSLNKIQQNFLTSSLGKITQIMKISI